MPVVVVGPVDEFLFEGAEEGLIEIPHPLRRRCPNTPRSVLLIGGCHKPDRTGLWRLRCTALRTAVGVEYHTLHVASGEVGWRSLRAARRWRVIL